MPRRNQGPNYSTPGPTACAEPWEREYRTRIDGLRTFARTVGDGSEVVLIHGAGISSAYWIPAQRALADRGFRVHALDLPGFGKSENPPWPSDLSHLIRHSLQWVRWRTPGPVHLVGQSLGCEVALGVAAELQERARSVVLAGPAGLPLLKSLARQWIEAAIDVPREPLALYRVVIPAYLRCGLARLLRVLWEQKRHRSRHLLETLPQPMLVVRGERDPIASRQRVNCVAAVAPHARVATIPGAHGAHFSHPVEFAAVLSSFLCEVEAAPLNLQRKQVPDQGS